MAESWSNKRLTKEEWVAKARSIWGDAYDYSESEYLNGNDPILIRCKKHDKMFVVMAGNHIGKEHAQGCPFCALDDKMEIKIARAKSEIEILKKKQLEKNYSGDSVYDKQLRFIEKCKNLYGDKYDYSKVKYVDFYTKVTIICKKHGEFNITPAIFLHKDHGTGHGCPDCEGLKKVRRFTQRSFLAEMKRLYGDKFDFSQTVFRGMSKSVEFICPRHGKQKRLVDSMLSGSGCRYCNGELFWPEDFPRRAREIHGDKYEYPDIPKSHQSMITIICKKHGAFKQRVDIHLAGCGCPQCAGINHLSLEERKKNFIQRSKERYNDRYDYSLVEYVDKNTPVKIRCKEHDYVFTVLPDTHIRRSSGCPICNDSIGETEVRLWLDKNHIHYETEYLILNENLQCRRSYLRVDFYLPDHNTFIEFHGEQHFKNIPHFHLTKDWTFEDQQLRDQTLREYCQKHKIVLVEIRYDQIDKIENILKEKVLERKN